MSRRDLVSKAVAGDHFLQREGQAEPRPAGRRSKGDALETDQRTLDEDLASSHCPILSPFHQASAVHSLKQ